MTICQAMCGVGWRCPPFARSPNAISSRLLARRGRGGFVVPCKRSRAYAGHRGRIVDNLHCRPSNRAASCDFCLVIYWHCHFRLIMLHLCFRWYLHVYVARAQLVPFQIVVHFICSVLPVLFLVKTLKSVIYFYLVSMPSRRSTQRS